MSATGSKVSGIQAEVSVVITTRNRLEWLKQCLASALTQSGAEFEVIVVNDASEDGTREWLDRLKKPRVSIFHNNTCAERSASRNLALAQARGAYVMFLDDDDLLWPGALKALSDALRAHPEAVAAVGARQAWFVKERYRRREPHPRRKLVRNIFSEVLFGWCVTGGQALLRSGEVKRAGGFDVSLNRCEDRDLWQKLTVTHPVAFIPDTVLTYRVHREDCLPPGRLALRERVAGRAIAALPRENRGQALLIRRSRMWFDRSDDLLSSGRTWQGIWAACNGMASRPGLLFSPLIGEWVVRWLLGRGFRHYIPPRNIETEGADPLIWSAPPGALAFHPEAPIVHPGSKTNPVIVQYRGGIGNQLFQYAVALQLASQTGAGVVHVPTDNPLRKNGPDLQALLGPLTPASMLDLARFLLPPSATPAPIRKEYRRIRKHLVNGHAVWKDKTRPYFPEQIERPFVGGGLLINGFFQSLQWVDGGLEAVSRQIISRMPRGAAVRPDVTAVNFRTGRDFQNLGWSLSLDYYQRTLEKCDPHRETKLWLVGDVRSDLPTFAQVFKGAGWTIEDAPRYEVNPAIDDFWNLATAGRLLISCSTFAWWAAVTGDYLNHPQKHVVYFPDPWQPRIRHDLCRPDWIRSSHQ